MIKALLGILKAAVIAVESVVSLAVKLVYAVLKFLHLRLLALYVLICAVLAIFFPVFGEGIVYFWVGFALCCVITAGSWVYALRRKMAARPRPAEEPEKREKRAKKPPEEQEQEAVPAQAPVQSAPQPQPQQAPPARYPKYFDVEGAPQYFFAEYPDRYELYRRDEEGAVYIRTDYKQQTEKPW